MKPSEASRGVPGKSDIMRLLEMVNGYQQTCIIAAALQTGLIDRLGEGPSTVDALATHLGAHAPSMKRLVVALRVLGLVDRHEDGIALTGRGKLLLRGGFGVRDWAALVGEEYLSAWANLRESVMTGTTAFESAFGMTAWDHRKRHPELNESFNRVTSSVQLRAISAVLAAYDFTGRRCIVDVGGGHGNLIAGILKKHDEAQGILFDQPHVVEGAESVLVGARVKDRCRVVGGSFLEAVPGGGDIYLMKHVLHNWDDDECVTILRNCRSVMAESTGLLVLENVMPEESLEGAAPLVMLDLHMMAVLGGRERTLSEYDALAARAGLRLARRIATREGAPDILELETRGST